METKNQNTEEQTGQDQDGALKDEKTSPETEQVPPKDTLKKKVKVESKSSFLASEIKKSISVLEKHLMEHPIGSPARLEIAARIDVLRAAL